MSRSLGVAVDVACGDLKSVESVWTVGAAGATALRLECDTLAVAQANRRSHHQVRGKEALWLLSM